jgi:hypothetical protein
MHVQLVASAVRAAELRVAESGGDRLHEKI